LIYVPRGFSFTAQTPRGTGLTYKAKYAALGVIAFDEPAIVDGMNEKGLSVGVFYFPHYAGYADASAQNALSPLDFSNWLITQFASVDEIKRALPSVSIVPTVYKQWGPAAPPFHYVVYEASGRCIVIEPVAGQLVVHDNPLGVVTNSPTFDWHLTNLNNFVHLSPFNVAPKRIAGVDFVPFGQGSGMIGLPGDFSPPSRFVRAALFSLDALATPDNRTAVLQAFHLLNQFDMPVGIIREKVGAVLRTDRTLATAVRDPKSLTYYFRTYEDQSIRSVDLKKFDPNGSQLLRCSVRSEQPIRDVSADFTPAAKTNF
jgi:choloylglycine hydrolase